MSGHETDGPIWDGMVHDVDGRYPLSTPGRPSSVVEINPGADTLRVCDETRPLKFFEHMVANWLIVDGVVRERGQWDSRSWSASRVAAYWADFRKYEAAMRDYERWLRRRRPKWLRRFGGVPRPYGPPPDHGVLITGMTILSSATTRGQEA